MFIVEDLYNDLLKISHLYCTNEQFIKDKDIIKLVEQDKKRESLQVVYIADQLSLLLEFLYIYGTIVFNRVFQIIESKISKTPQRTFRFKIFRNHYFKNLKISDNLKQRIYCFIVYRNKFIEHHDFKRFKGRSSFKDQVKNMRLSPIGRSFLEGGWIDNYKKIEILAKRHNCEKDMAINIVIPCLFNKVSWQHSDRKTIESLAEEMGCTSFNYYEINKLFKDFMNDFKNKYY